jgi:Uncharacterized protein conserved in bacteria
MSIRDLDKLLAELTVSQRPGSWCMVSGVALSEDIPVAAKVTEAEGTTAIISTADALKLGLEPEFVAAWLTLDVNSALDAVGLTAAVSSALAAHGIPCNVLAGYHHDHLLVPIERAELAIAILDALSEAHRP